MPALWTPPGWAAVGRVVGSFGPGVLTRLSRHSGPIGALRRMGRGVQDAVIQRWAFDSPVSADLDRLPIVIARKHIRIAAREQIFRDHLLNAGMNIGTGRPNVFEKDVIAFAIPS